MFDVDSLNSPESRALLARLAPDLVGLTDYLRAARNVRYLAAKPETAVPVVISFDAAT